MIHNKRVKSTAMMPEKYRGFSSDDPSGRPVGSGREKRSLNTVE